MDKLLAILVLVAAGCTSDGDIYLYSDVVIDAGFEADAETGGSGGDQDVFITGVGGGAAGDTDAGDAGDAGGVIISDSGVTDGGGEKPPVFSISDPGFIEGVWLMTRRMRPYECDGVTIDTSYPPQLEPQIYDVRFDADHRMYGGGDLTGLLWDPGWFVGDVWHPDERPSSQQGWHNIEVVAVDEDTLTGRAMQGGGGCSGEDHFALDLSRL